MGSDGGVRADKPPLLSFNSRSRMGSDTEGCAAAHRPRVSIHAPAWGATQRLVSDWRANHCFNSRSRMGSDRRTSH